MPQSNGSKKLKVFKYNPDTDKQPHYVTYDIPSKDITTVWEALDYIRENLDGSIGYYAHQSCCVGMCNVCNILINGKAKIACQTKLDDGMTVEPLMKNNVVVDLVNRIVRR